jgi:tetratricopeptide (TPR) repeat protein
MKLKKSFWVSICLLPLIFSACSSTKLSVPIPGRSEAVITNIYIEYLNIADIYFGLEKFDKAETYYKAAMGNKDIYWNAYYKLAKCYVYQSKWGDAQTAYETILKRDSENNSIKSSIAYIYAMNGNTDKALEIYSQLIEASSDQSEYLENYICVLLAAEKQEEAHEQFNLLAQKFPESKRLEELGKYFVEETEEESENNTEESGEESKSN